MERRINKYYTVFHRLLTEDMTAGAGGVFGDGPSMQQVAGATSSDTYAPGDARNIFNLGMTSRKGKVNTKRKKKRKK